MIGKLLIFGRKGAPWVGLLLLVVLFVSSIISAQSPNQRMVLHTFYGDVDIDDPLLVQLIQSKELERLKKIHQYGTDRYIVAAEEYTRYDHSLGVFYLLCRYGAFLKEQIAGLLHDASHTVFSHVGDHIFHHYSETSCYQDNIHLWYLANSAIAGVLASYNYTVEDIDPKNPHFTLLEQPLPNLCADRIDYNLQGGVLRGLIALEEVESILGDLHFEAGADRTGRWYFTSIESANKLGRVSLIMTETFWGAPVSLVTSSWIAEAVRRATEIGTLTFNDIHYSTDNIVWHKLLTSEDPVIKDRIRHSLNYEQYFSLCDPWEKEDRLVKGKFRGLDPLVLTEKGLQPLTQLDESYAKEFNRVKQVMQNGWRVKFINPEPYLAAAAASMNLSNAGR